MVKNKGDAPWFGILQACRQMGGNFTARDLAGAAKIGSTEDKDGATVSDGKQIASAWLSKLAKWGYVERVGTAKGDGRGRPVVIYKVTKVGMECEVTKGRVEQLVDAIRSFGEARGTRKEEASFASLIALADLMYHK